MGKRLYVGNLTYGSSDASLRQLFEAHGTVTSAQIIMDRDTGRSKGFGFVEMGSDAEAQAAISALNGKEVDGKSVLDLITLAPPEGATVRLRAKGPDAAEAMHAVEQMIQSQLED